MGVKNIVENLKKRGLKDVLDPNVWKTYAEYQDIEDNGLLLTVDDIDLYNEQYQYRKLRCSKCVDAGKCIGYQTEGCSCECPAKMMPPCAECVEGRWGAMKDTKEAWELEKKEKGIDIILFQP